MGCGLIHAGLRCDAVASGAACSTSGGRQGAMTLSRQSSSTTPSRAPRARVAEGDLLFVVAPFVHHASTACCSSLMRPRHEGGAGRAPGAGARGPRGTPRHGGSCGRPRERLGEGHWEGLGQKASEEDPRKDPEREFDHLCVPGLPDEVSDEGCEISAASSQDSAQDALVERLVLDLQVQHVRSRSPALVEDIFQN